MVQLVIWPLFKSHAFIVHSIVYLSLLPLSLLFPCQKFCTGKLFPHSLSPNSGSTNGHLQSLSERERAPHKATQFNKFPSKPFQTVLSLNPQMLLNFTPPLLISLLLLATLQLPYPSHASLGKNPQQSSKAGNGVVSVELWCVAKNNAETSALQTALDWACGTGGADCGPIQQGGPCYDLSDIQATASFAFNDYFLKHGLTEDSCYFDNTAALTSLNPSKSLLLFSSPTCI